MKQLILMSLLICTSLSCKTAEDFEKEKQEQKKALEKLDVNKGEDFAHGQVWILMGKEIRIVKDVEKTPHYYIGGTHVEAFGVLEVVSIDSSHTVFEITPESLRKVGKFKSRW